MTKRRKPSDGRKVLLVVVKRVFCGKHGPDGILDNPQLSPKVFLPWNRRDGPPADRGADGGYTAVGPERKAKSGLRVSFGNLDRLRGGRKTVSPVRSGGHVATPDEIPARALVAPTVRKATSGRAAKPRKKTPATAKPISGMESDSSPAGKSKTEKTGKCAEGNRERGRVKSDGGERLEKESAADGADLAKSPEHEKRGRGASPVSAGSEPSLQQNFRGPGGKTVIPELKNRPRFPDSTVKRLPVIAKSPPISGAKILNVNSSATNCTDLPFHDCGNKYLVSESSFLKKSIDLLIRDTARALSGEHPQRGCRRRFAE